jgi:16S rRNA (guanine(966)-N(2))-methyltransferase RsmD
MPLRPTPDAMRERVFAVLGDLVSGARFLDLFAGTGAVGFEALSRGALRVVFVDSHRSAARLVRTNCKNLDLDTSRVRLIVQPALNAVRDLAAQGDAFDLAWADPPFETWQMGLEALATAFAAGLLTQDALACLECPAKADVEGMLPSHLEIARDLAGGASRVVMLRKLRA